MPSSRPPWRWPVPQMQPASQAGPQLADTRPCGCHLDVAVFGHDRHYCTNPAEGAA